MAKDRNFPPSPNTRDFTKHPLTDAEQRWPEDGLTAAKDNADIQHYLDWLKDNPNTNRARL